MVREQMPERASQKLLLEGQREGGQCGGEFAWLRTGWCGRSRLLFVLAICLNGRVVGLEGGRGLCTCTQNDRHGY